MPRGRDNRQDRREERHAGPAAAAPAGGGPTNYQMRQKMFSIGNDYWVEDSNGNKAYKVDGKALRVRSTLNLEDSHGNTVAQIQERKARVKDSMEIEDANGNQIGMVKKAMVTPVRERYTVKIKNGPDLDVQGNIMDHEYSIGEGRDKVAEVSKKWFRVRDSYGIQVDGGQDPAVIIAIAIDEMSH
jgi:uncharacterized protein YxjI